MKNKISVALSALCLLACNLDQGQPKSVMNEDISMRDFLNKKICRGKPLPVIADDKNQLIVEIVTFGSNFPVESKGTDQRVFVRFEQHYTSLFLIVSSKYTESDIRSALTDRLAPPVIVKKFAISD